jgi:hypothetical protein
VAKKKMEERQTYFMLSIPKLTQEFLDFVVENFAQQTQKFLHWLYLKGLTWEPA